MRSQYEFSLWRTDFLRNRRQESQLFAVTFVANPFRRFSAIWETGEDFEAPEDALPRREMAQQADGEEFHDDRF